MWFANRTQAAPTYLQTAVEYRDRLIAELAKVDAFLLEAGKSAGRRECEALESPLLDCIERVEEAAH